MKKISFNKKWKEWLWEFWCIVSVIGIWPRYIEPNWLSITKITLPIPRLPPQLSGLKILHFSDLHWDQNFSQILKNRIVSKVRKLQPDLIFFTGDFLIRSKSEDFSGLREFLRSFQAKVGCFAILGNHDYQDFVTINEKGDYDVEDRICLSTIHKGFRRLFSNPILTGKITTAASQVKDHTELLQLLKGTPFHVLQNETVSVMYEGMPINICGLGDYYVGRCDPSKAFQNYDPKNIGIILSHNPDTMKILQSYPGEMILAGHTHGNQINLPWIGNRLTRMENKAWKRGLIRLQNRWLYVSRGISGTMKFRWFSRPEIAYIILTSGEK